MATDRVFYASGLGKQAEVSIPDDSEIIVDFFGRNATVQYGRPFVLRDVMKIQIHGIRNPKIGRLTNLRFVRYCTMIGHVWQQNSSKNTLRSIVFPTMIAKVVLLTIWSTVF